MLERVFHLAYALGIRFHVEETTFLEDQKRWRELTKDIKFPEETDSDGHHDEIVPEIITEAITKVPEGADKTDPFWHQREDIWPAKSDKLGYLGDTSVIEITAESSDTEDDKKETGLSKPTDTVTLYNKTLKLPAACRERTTKP